ncbi:MAG: thiamine diphosphokinase [Acholeplasmataceae bacterium]|nr:thiamine diphosphokinase [Acholeplasmataceae bacterium]
MRVIVVTHPTPKDIRKAIDLRADDYIIGVDQAILNLYKQRIMIHLAIGDFDSLSNQGLLSTLNVIRLDPIKDETDTYQALVEASKMNADEIFLIGGFCGERIEHFIAHIMLFDAFPKLVMKNEESTLFVLLEGTHHLTFQGYVSLFAYPLAILTLKGFMYPLNTHRLEVFDPLGISNEIVGEQGEIDIHQGRVLVVLSKKEKK